MSEQYDDEVLDYWSEPCNICGAEEATFEAGGAWWCPGCAVFITDEHIHHEPLPSALMYRRIEDVELPEEL